MPSLLRFLRQQAFVRQNGKCWYCAAPMWERESVPPFGTCTFKAVQRLRCTAEHLVARRDGGPTHPTNIVAACAHCNRTRHKQRKPLHAEHYFRKVQHRMTKRQWHPLWVHQFMQHERLTTTPWEPHEPYQSQNMDRRELQAKQQFTPEQCPAASSTRSRPSSLSLQPVRGLDGAIQG